MYPHLRGDRVENPLRRWRYRDSAYLYMLFDYVCGGELFSYLRNAGRFGTNTGGSTDLLTPSPLNPRLPKTTEPPIVPRVTYEGDTRNFDDYPETDWKSAPTVGETEQKLFEDF
uniref:AGC-kinase C-terminal domain-containing protein n=1 Tax=Timema genevievae TaxID=629358 RepID=A0A7R9PID5_TIMGE|nr:unnamed protein product [Timema genevievae]